MPMKYLKTMVGQETLLGGVGDDDDDDDIDDASMMMMMIAQETVVEVSEEEEDEEWGTDTQGTERTDSSNKVSWPSSMCSGMHGSLPCEEMQKKQKIWLC